jgi:hypothetical protein
MKNERRAHSRESCHWGRRVDGAVHQLSVLQSRDDEEKCCDLTLQWEQRKFALQLRSLMDLEKCCDLTLQWEQRKFALQLRSLMDFSTSHTKKALAVAEDRCFAVAG